MLLRMWTGHVLYLFTDGRGATSKDSRKVSAADALILFTLDPIWEKHCSQCLKPSHPKLRPGSASFFYTETGRMSPYLPGFSPQSAPTVDGLWESVRCSKLWDRNTHTQRSNVRNWENEDQYHWSALCCSLSQTVTKALPCFPWLWDSSSVLTDPLTSSSSFHPSTGVLLPKSNAKLPSSHYLMRGSAQPKQ